MISVSGLLEFEELGARLVAGASGASHRVRWAHVSELPDPTPWLDGGELIMTTGLAIPEPASDQAAYVSRLAAAGVAAVAIGENMHAPPLSSEMLARSDTLDLPILLVRREIPFIALAQRVASANRDSVHESLASHLRVLEITRRIAEEPVDPETIIARMSALTGFDLYALGEDGEPLFQRGRTSRVAIEPGFPPDQNAFAASADGHRRRAFVRPLTAKGILVGKLYAVTQRSGATQSLILDHVVTVTGLLSSELVAQRDRDRERRTDRFRQLLTDRAAAVVNLFDHVDPMAPAQVACFRSTINDDEIWPAFHHRAASLHIDVAFLEVDELRLLLAAADTASLARLRSEIERAFEAPVGLSSEHQAATAIELLRFEAVNARRHAELSRRSSHAFDEVRDLTRGALDDPGAETIAREVLRPLVEHDQATSTGLIRTLQVFLEKDRKWNRAAGELGIHRQTLVHRVKRIEQLTGRSLRSTEDVAVLWLGLRAGSTPIEAP